MNTVCAKPQSVLTAELESALVITLGPTLPQILVADPTEHPHARLWHTGSVNGPLGAPASSQAASHNVPAHAPQIAGSPPVRPSSSALCVWHGVCNGETGWARGDGAGHAGLFS